MVMAVATIVIALVCYPIAGLVVPVVTVAFLGPMAITLLRPVVVGRRVNMLMVVVLIAIGLPVAVAHLRRVVRLAGAVAVVVAGHAGRLFSTVVAAPRFLSCGSGMLPTR
jgi:hypothetical protein